MVNLQVIISQTPAWVWVLLVYLCIIGVKRCYTRTIRVWQLFIAPCIFLGLSIKALLPYLATTPLAALAWLGAIWVGLALGYYHIKAHAIQIDPQRKALVIPGDWTMLALILSIFAIQYTIHASLAIHPSLVHHAKFIWSTTLLSGLLTGMANGRSLGYYLTYRKHLYL